MHLQNLFGRENANFIGQENTNCEENSQKSSWEPYGLYSLFHSFIETKINAKSLLYVKSYTSYSIHPFFEVLEFLVFIH